MPEEEVRLCVDYSKNVIIAVLSIALGGLMFMYANAISPTNMSSSTYVGYERLLKECGSERTADIKKVMGLH